MTDRELLELAAKAAGIGPFEYEQSVAAQWNIYHGEDMLEAWNPLTDDGDALRLAASLRMALRYEDDEVWVRAKAKPAHADWASEPISGDIDAATRRAITRAAAEICKAM